MVGLEPTLNGISARLLCQIGIHTDKRAPGFEPGKSPPWQGGVLPVTPCSHKKLVADDGIEPPKESRVQSAAPYRLANRQK